MRSFALSALIPLAFGIFASAAPTPHAVGDGGLIVVDAGVEVGRRGSGGGGFGGGSGSSSGGGSGGKNGLITADVDLDVLGLITADVDLDVLRREVKSDDALIDLNAKVKVGRRDDEKTLDSILCGVVSSVDALVEKISNFNSVECTVEILDPILNEVKDILNGAINDVNGLKGFAAGDILKTVDGLLDPTGLAKLLANVIIIVVKLVNLVLGLVSSVVKNDVLSLLVDILCLVGELLTCVLNLVDSVLTGVLGILCPLVEDVLPIFDQLKIQIVIDLFKL